MPIEVGPATGVGPEYAGLWTESADEQLTIGSVTMSGIDEYGVVWTLSSLQGWDDGWEPNGTLTQKVGAHGAWASPGYAVPRLVQVDGMLEAGTWDAASLAWERLMASVPYSTLATMTVFCGEGGIAPRQIDVRQTGKPTLERLGGDINFTFAVEAPDPRRYSVDEQVSSIGLPVTTGGLSLPLSLPLSVGATVQTGRVAVTNAGKEAAPVVLEVAGPCPPATVTNLATGQRLVIPEAVAAGRTLTLDSSARTALLDAAASRTVTGTWFDIVPGVNEIAFNATSYDAGARLTIRHRHAWR